jgi:hypothetical protein
MDRGHAPRGVLLGVLACLLSCSSATPSPTLTAGSASGTFILPPPTSPAATTPVPAPSAAASPSASTPPALALELHKLLREWSMPTGPTVASDGVEIAWPVVTARSEEAGPVVPDIAVFRPAAGAPPTIVYKHPDRDSLIWALAVRNSHYAFLEMNARLLGESGWRLWALAGAGRQAVLLDTRDGPDDGRPAAAFALTDAGVVWTAVHDRDGVPTFELRTAGFDGSSERVLLATAVGKRQYWYPSVAADGTTLSYSTVERASGGDRFGLWTLDLSRPDSQPVPIPGVEDGTEPVLTDRTLAWRTVDDNVANWGRGLVVAANGGAPAVIAPGELSGIAHLSMGNRFVAFETISHQAVQLYDTVEQHLVTVEQHTAPDTVGIQPGWTLVAGDLLVFRRVDYADDADAAGPPEVIWSILPPAP